MVKRINVSIKESDRDFCINKDLKPSHLLRERITQIRDDSIEYSKKRINEAERKGEMLTKKLDSFIKMYQGTLEFFEMKFGKEAIEELYTKI